MSTTQIHGLSKLPPLPEGYEFLMEGDKRCEGLKIWLDGAGFDYWTSPASGYNPSTNLESGVFYCRPIQLAPGRNINKLTTKQVGCDEGWRLVTEEEFKIESQQYSKTPLFGKVEGRESLAWNPNRNIAYRPNVDYRTKVPLPSPIATGNNPHKLTISQVGEGHRLLTEDEIKWRKDNNLIRPWVDQWYPCQTTWDNSGHGNCVGCTYRVPLDYKNPVLPLLTPEDFIAGSPWWIKWPNESTTYMVSAVNNEGVFVIYKGENNFYTFNSLRNNSVAKVQRSNNGTTWTDC